MASQRNVLRDVPALPEGVPTTYVNSANILSSVYDLTMDMGVIVGVKGGKIETRVLQRIVMSPSHAKVFLEILKKHVEVYEETFGPIPSPSETPDDATALPPPSSRSRSGASR